MLVLALEFMNTYIFIQVSVFQFHHTYYFSLNQGRVLYRTVCPDYLFKKTKFHYIQYRKDYLEKI
jgi:hypothetical protein